jgi:hypothetical protein
MNCARSAPPDSGHFLLGKCVLSSLNAKFSPLRGPESALRAARYAGRATRAGVLRTAREADTCGPIQLMKPSVVGLYPEHFSHERARGASQGIEPRATYPYPWTRSGRRSSRGI